MNWFRIGSTVGFSEHNVDLSGSITAGNILITRINYQLNEKLAMNLLNIKLFLCLAKHHAMKTYLLLN
jgi:hypothetical protein